MGWAEVIVPEPSEEQTVAAPQNAKLQKISCNLSEKHSKTHTHNPYKKPKPLRLQEVKIHSKQWTNKKRTVFCRKTCFNMQQSKLHFFDSRFRSSNSWLQSAAGWTVQRELMVHTGVCLSLQVWRAPSIAICNRGRSSVECADHQLRTWPSTHQQYFLRSLLDFAFWTWDLLSKTSKPIKENI